MVDQRQNVIIFHQDPPHHPAIPGLLLHGKARGRRDCHDVLDLASLGGLWDLRLGPQRRTQSQMGTQKLFIIKGSDV